MVRGDKVYGTFLTEDDGKTILETWMDSSTELGTYTRLVYKGKDPVGAVMRILEMYPMPRVDPRDVDLVTLFGEQ